MRLPSHIDFAAFLQYSPRGISEVERQSRVLRDAIKRDGHLSVKSPERSERVRGIELIVQWLKRAHSIDSMLQEVIGPDHVLVPVPRSAPLARPDALWPSLRICNALVSAGLGAAVVPLIVRHTAVQKSAFAAAGQRPSAMDHYNSSAIDENVLIPKTPKITLVDDFVTRGATFIGMYPHIRSVLPQARVSCFALVRTTSFDPVSKIVAPVRGVITANLFGNTRREP
jgi:hypothetical protein